MKKIGYLFIFQLVVTSLIAQVELFRDTTYPLDERIADLIGRMTIEEKCAQLLYDSPAIPRLDIPEYNWWNEGLHGVARFGRATVFPQPIALAATFDTLLVRRIASAISDEARAKHNAARSIDNYNRYTGLTLWSPNINIFRDPRWGRGMETWGEDPWLTARMGISFVKGLQGDHPVYLKTAACMKHFAVHSGPESERHSFNADPPLKDLYETYLPAFRALATEGKVEATMGAYTALYGVPTSASDLLLNDLLRGEWGFEGHIVSDCWALQDFHAGHNYTVTPAESAALALKKGVDLNCGETFVFLPEALESGLIEESDVDKALTRLLKTRFKLGFFDPSEANPYHFIPEEVINCREHRLLAAEAAAKSVVLMKNQGALPLKKDCKDLYVLGPHAADVDILLGNYNGQTGDARTIIEGITSKVHAGTRLQYRKGFQYDQYNKNSENWAFDEPAEAEAVIVVIGLSTLSEGEEGEAIASDFKSDRRDLDLPAAQLHYLKQLREKVSKPLIVVVTGGSPVNLQEVYQLADALLFVWYPGEEGGNAVADILFGDISPSGKLPITFPTDHTTLPDYKDYSMRERTYKYSTSESMFPFGFGLGYAEVLLSDLTVSSGKLKEGETLHIRFFVENRSDIEAEEVIQLYTHTHHLKDAPLYDLKEFVRVNLKPYEKKRVEIELPYSRFNNVDQEGNSIYVKGKHTIFVSTSLPVRRSVELGSPQWLEAPVILK